MSSRRLLLDSNQEEKTERAMPSPPRRLLVESPALAEESEDSGLIILDLTKAREICDKLSASFCRFCGEAAAYCLGQKGHHCQATLQVDGAITGTAEVKVPKVTKHLIRTYADLPYSTEHGAYAVAMPLVSAFTEYHVVERARRGPGFDFWLHRKGSKGVLFQDCARLEVSGLLEGNDAAINRRIREKSSQIAVSDGILPGWVVVVEFSRPHARTFRK